jgi:hypothetical protein
VQSPNNEFLDRSPKQECIIIFSDQSGFTSEMNKKLNETFHKMVLHHLAACFNLSFDGSEKNIKFCAIPIKTVGDEIVLAVTWKQKYNKIQKGEIVSFILKKIRSLMRDLDKRDIHVKTAIHYVNKAFSSDTYSSYLTRLTKGEWIQTQGLQKMPSISFKKISIPIPLSPHDVFGSEINYAARMMSIAKGHMALLSEDVYKFISDRNGNISGTFSDLKKEFACEDNKFPSELFYNIRSFSDFEKPKRIYQLPIMYTSANKHEKIHTINLDVNILTLIYAERYKDISIIEKDLLSNDEIKSSYLSYGYKDLEPIINEKAAQDEISVHRQAIMIRWGFYDLETYHFLINRYIWNIKRPIKHVKSNVIIERYPIENIDTTKNYSGFLCLLKFKDISDVTADNAFVCNKIKINKNEILKSLHKKQFTNNLSLIEIGTMFGEYDVFVIFAYPRNADISIAHTENFINGEILAKSIAEQIRNIYPNKLRATNGVEIWPLIDLKVFDVLKYLEPKGKEFNTIYGKK